jgi:hypothetical protein
MTLSMIILKRRPVSEYLGRQSRAVGLELPILGEIQQRGNVARNSAPEYAFACVKDLLLTLLQLAVVGVKLCRPGGVRAVVAENLLLKH